MLVSILPLAAAANAALLALALARRAWTKRAAAGLYAAAFLLVAAAAVSVITLDHAGLAGSGPMPAFAEGALTLAAGPLLFLFIARLLGVRTPRYVLFAPLLGFVAAAAFAPAAIAQAIVIEHLVLVQMLFTLAAGALALRRQPAGRRGAQARRLALAAIVAMAALHAAQLARMAWSDVLAIVNIVPLVGAASFLAATAAIYFGGRISALDSLLDAPPAPDDAARALVARLEAALRQGLLGDARLSIARAASACGADSEALARALAALHGLSFSEFLQRRRVEEAQRLLADPAEARTSMEAIGLLAGFGSRSGFYKAFAEQVGMSPAAYRAQKAVQSAESGHQAGG